MASKMIMPTPLTDAVLPPAQYVDAITVPRAMRCSVAADHQINHRCRCLPKEPWMPPTEAPTHAATRQNYHRCRHCRSYHRCLDLPKLVLKLSPAKVTINAAARRHSQTRQKCGNNDTTTKSKQPIPSLLVPMPPVPRCHQYLH